MDYYFILVSMKFIKIILLSVLILAPIYTQEKPPQKKEAQKETETKKTSTEKTGPRRWGYVYSNSFENFSKDYITRLTRNYDILCVTGLLLRGTGQIRFTNELINKLEKAGLRNGKNKPIIYPMLSLSSIKDGINFFNNENARQKSLEYIIAFLKENNFQGIHLDFEGLPQEYARPMGNYLKDLKELLNAEGMKLSFAIFPQLDYGDERLLHKPEYIAPNVDEVTLMAYDFHNTKTPAGCVTSEKWATKNLEEILKQFKPDQIWLGVPAYGYEWYINSKQTNVVSAREADTLMKVYPFSREESGCIKITKKERGKESLIYFSDSTLRERLEKIAAKFNVNGVAVWRLGLEED
jgi:spore germination protein YaaH